MNCRCARLLHSSFAGKTWFHAVPLHPRRLRLPAGLCTVSLSPAWPGLPPTVRQALLPLLCLALTTGGAPSPASATTLNVPAQYAHIQDAINAAVNGDTVLIADGTYTGPGNVDLDFGGRNITVKSQHGAAATVIDCQGSAADNHRGFYLHSGETKAVLNGLTVQNGYESQSDGGGILTEGVGVTIQNCIVKGNTLTANYGFGGGIYSINGNGPITVTHCTLSGNTAAYGGGIYSFSANADGPITLTNCLVTGNVATVAAGGGKYKLQP